MATTTESQSFSKLFFPDFLQRTSMREPNGMLSPITRRFGRRSACLAQVTRLKRSAYVVFWKLVPTGLLNWLNQQDFLGLSGVVKLSIPSKSTHIFLKELTRLSWSFWSSEAGLAACFGAPPRPALTYINQPGPARKFTLV